MAYWRREQRDDGGMSKALDRIALEAIDWNTPVVFMLGGAESTNYREKRFQRNANRDQKHRDSSTEHSIAFVENILGSLKPSMISSSPHTPPQIIGVTYEGSKWRTLSHLEFYTWRDQHQYDPQAVEIADALLPFLQSPHPEDLRKLHNITFISNSYGTHVAQDIASYLGERLKERGLPEWQIKERIRQINSIELSGLIDHHEAHQPRFNTVKFNFFDDKALGWLRVRLPESRRRDALQVSMESYGLWVTQPLPERLHFDWRSVSVNGSIEHIRDWFTVAEIEKQHGRVPRNHSKCLYLCENVEQQYYSRYILQRAVRNSVSRDSYTKPEDLVLESAKGWEVSDNRVSESEVSVGIIRGMMVGKIQASLAEEDRVNPNYVMAGFKGWLPRRDRE